MTYPTDVQAALDHSAEVGWTTERYQAVLALALHHLEEPVELELVFMYADEEIEASIKPTMWDQRTTFSLPAGQVYMVCPHCLSVTDPAHYERGVEARRAYWNDDDPSVPSLDIGDSQDFYCDDSWYECSRCGGHLELPDWLDISYV